MGDLKETAAQVAALIPRYLWELMDEEQKDALLEKVILPRYMQTTHDGVELSPKWWAQQVGASAKAIQSRVYRLQHKARASANAGSSTPSWNDTVGSRVTRQALRERPEQFVDQIASALADPEVRARVDAKITRTPSLRAAIGSQMLRPSSEPPPRTPEQIAADRVARQQELGITPPPLDPWGPYWKAVGLLRDVHERMYEGCWDRMDPAAIASIALTAEREARFLDSLATAAQDRVAQTTS
jgi:hypothetical protein